MDIYSIIAEFAADPARRSRAFGGLARLVACAAAPAKRSRALGRLARLAACAAAALAIAAASPGARAGELVVGGDFESGAFPAGWVHGAGTLNGGSNPDWADHDVVLETTYNGSYCAILGFKDTSPKRDRFGYMYYPVTVPADVSSAVLNFRFRVQGFDGGGNDPFIVTVRDASGNVLETIVKYDFAQRSAQFKDSGWISDDGTGPVGFDMSAYAGQTVYLDFRQYNLNDNQYETWVFVDDVSFIYRKYVDLAVDGDGDDVFAAPGSGGGGQSVRSGGEGETVTYLIDIENESADIDSYTIAVSPPAGWPVEISYAGTVYTFPWNTPPVPAGASITAEVSVTIPPGAAQGDYTTILDAVSISDPGRFDSVSMLTGVVAASFMPDLVIDGDGFGVVDPGGGGGYSIAEAGPGQTASYAIRLHNDGAVEDSFEVSLQVPSPLTAILDEGGTPHTGTFRTGPVAPGDSIGLILEVSVPASMSGGDYSSRVFASSLSDGSKADGVTAVTRVTAPRLDMIISGNGDGIIDLTGSGKGGTATMVAQRGAIAYFPVVIQNEGGVVDSFQIVWNKPHGGWTAVINDGAADHVFPWTTPAIGPGEELVYTLAVNVPPNAAYNTYISVLDAVSSVDPSISESVTASVAVATGNEVDLLINGNGDGIYAPAGTGLGGSVYLSAAPGDVVTLTLSVQNQAGVDTFDIGWTAPEGWTVLIGGSEVPLSRVPSGDYQVEVTIPEDCSLGAFDIIIDGAKSDMTYFVDSVKGRIYVSVPNDLDAVINGSGDEIYGFPGTGAGGSSTAGTIAGGNVTFTVELQNQGLLAESYRIDWAGQPGWTELLGGQASPATTPLIPAGKSGFFTFWVNVPVTAAEGDYSYILDMVSTSDSTHFESVEAVVRVNPPPGPDLVIDGSGAFEIAAAGTGGGGSAIAFGGPGELLTVNLDVYNRGLVADSFRVSWNTPAGWPAGSVLLRDVGINYPSPFVTPLLAPGASASYSLIVLVPAGADLRNRIIVDAFSLSGLLEDSALLEVVTAAYVRGRVFDDADHDGTPDPGEGGWSGVQVTLDDPAGPVTAMTGVGGWYTIEMEPGAARNVFSGTLSGMFSITPDTVSTGLTAAGDTVHIDFGDVMMSDISPDMAASGPAGGVITAAHTIVAGTAGQAALSVSLPAGWTEEWYRDVNSDGVLDPLDTRLTAADLDLDPAVPGRDVVPVIMCVYVPAGTPAGTEAVVQVRLDQNLSGTPLVTSSSAADRLTVLASASGMLRLVKQVDLDHARPGDVVTYTIIFSNPGTDDVMQIEITDPVSPDVDLVTGSFGPGADIEWVRGGSSVYLTADPADADEALYDPSTGVLRVILSRQAPYSLAPGEEGRIIYRVRIR